MTNETNDRPIASKAARATGRGVLYVFARGCVHSGGAIGAIVGTLILFAIGKLGEKAMDKIDGTPTTDTNNKD